MSSSSPRVTSKQSNRSQSQSTKTGSSSSSNSRNNGNSRKSANSSAASDKKPSFSTNTNNHTTTKNNRLKSQTTGASVGANPERSTSAKKPTAIASNSSKKHAGQSREMIMTNSNQELNSENECFEQETDVDEEKSTLLSSAGAHSSSSTDSSNSPKNNSKTITKSTSTKTQIDEHLETLPDGWEHHSDKIGPYYWHISTGVIQRTRPTASELSPSKKSILVCHDDEEINFVNNRKVSLISDTDNYYDDDDDELYYENGAALTANEDDFSTATLVGDRIGQQNDSTFVVHPVGCCEFDETQLVSTSNTKAIQRCILKLSNQPTGESVGCCWGLTQAQPVLLKLFDDYIQFTDLTTNTLLRSQPIQTIRTWAVDDDNNFAFVIEDMPNSSNGLEEGDNQAIDYALLKEPTLICYVFRSMDDDDDMSCKVASKLNEQINRHKEQLSHRLSKSTRVQQMVEQRPLNQSILHTDLDQTTLDGDNDSNQELDDEDLKVTNEMTMNVKYIGKTSVPRPTGIDILNVAIDKCLAGVSKAQINRAIVENVSDNYIADLEDISPLLQAKLHVSPSSVIVENVTTGDIIVECRIRYLTFMGISKRDIRWCGFIMQNATNKTFVAHCFECYPTAGHVCEAIQASCSRMYEKVLKNSSAKHQPETMSIIPTNSKIRNTLAKTLSRIKLNPLIN